MKQQTRAIAADQNAQYEQYRKPTKRDTFLATMEQIVPWSELWSVIASPVALLERLVNRGKSKVRARVEHVFGVVKRLWGFDKARYRGLSKNGT